MASGSQTMVKVACPECGAEFEVPATTMQGEIVQCGECATELEVVGVKPFKLEAAPEVEEDWGE